MTKKERILRKEKNQKTESARRRGLERSTAFDPLPSGLRCHPRELDSAGGWSLDHFPSVSKSVESSHLGEVGQDSVLEPHSAARN